MNFKILQTDSRKSKWDSLSGTKGVILCLHATSSLDDAWICFVLIILSPVQGAGRNGADSNSMEFEAKSARDGAWLVLLWVIHI